MILAGASLAGALLLAALRAWRRRPSSQVGAPAPRRRPAPAPPPRRRSPRRIASAKVPHSRSRLLRWKTQEGGMAALGRPEVFIDGKFVLPAKRKTLPARALLRGQGTRRGGGGGVPATPATAAATLESRDFPCPFFPPCPPPPARPLPPIACSTLSLLRCLATEPAGDQPRQRGRGGLHRRRHGRGRGCGGAP